MRGNYWNIIGILIAFSLTAQKAEKTEYEYISKGNELYRAKDYPNAKTEYAKAQKEHGNSFESTFNLGNAYYKQDSSDQAVSQFQSAASAAKTKPLQAQAYHNLGNAHLQKKQYKESIDAYKEALRRNPSDEETRYNLAYAQKMLKAQEQNQKNNKDKNKDQKDNKDQKNQDQKNQDKKGDQKKDDKGKDQQDKNKDSKNDQGKNGDQQDKDANGGKAPKENPQKEQKAQKGTMSKEQADKLLNAIDQEEDQLRKGIRLKEEKSKPKYIDKDW